MERPFFSYNTSKNFDKVFFLGQNVSKEISDNMELSATKDQKPSKIQQEKIQNTQNQVKNKLKETIWISYRKNFDKINLQSQNSVFNFYGLLNSKTTSDSHWGCMLRCGQNILAETIKRHILTKFLNNQRQQYIKQLEQDEINKQIEEKQKQNLQSSTLSEFQKIENYDNEQIFTQKKPDKQENLKKEKQFESKLTQSKLQFIQQKQQEIIELFADNVLSEDQKKKGAKLEQLYVDLSQNNNEQNQQNNNNNDKQKEELKDDYGANYSIQRICYQSNKQYGMQPGEWYRPNRIMYVLQQLHNKNPYKEAADMKLLTVNSDLPIVYEEILQEMCDDPSVQVCENKEHKQQNLIDFNNKKYYKYENEKQKYSVGLGKQWDTIVCPQCHKYKKSLSLFIIARIGLEKPEEQYLKQIMQIMQFELSTGIIGGKGDKAHYFIGSVNDNQLIYLDPHTTHQALTQENKGNEKILKTFFNDNISLLPISKLNATLGFGFYIHDFDDLDLFYNFMNNKFDTKEFFISFTKKDEMKKSFDNFNNRNQDGSNSSFEMY